MSEAALDDERRTARANLSAGLLRAERANAAARVALALATSLDDAQLDHSLRSAVDYGRRLEELRDLYLAAHGRGAVKR